jgi:hypothetical protein
MTKTKYGGQLLCNVQTKGWSKIKGFGLWKAVAFLIRSLHLPLPKQTKPLTSHSWTSSNGPNNGEVIACRTFLFFSSSSSFYNGAQGYVTINKIMDLRMKSSVTILNF